MHSTTRRRLVAAGSVNLVLGSAGLLSTTSARAQINYPSKPIKLIVPFSKGGSTDIVARSVAPALSRILGQNVNIENISGAGGTVGARALARAENDGHTLGMATVSTTGTGPIVRKVIKYDPLVDFAPVIKLVDVPGVISVHPDFPASNYQQFISQIRPNPGRYTYASSGLGGVQHMGMELFKIRNQIYLVHLPYRGAGPALRDVIAGKIDIMWDNLSSSLPHIKAGRLRPIGLVSEQRSPQLPELKTFKELGVRDYRAETYFGVLAPQGTSKRTIHTLNRALNLALADPAVKQSLVLAGGVPVGGSPAVLHRQIVSELRKWGEVARYAKIKV